MPSQAPKRLHHSRTSSLEASPIIPMSTTIDSTNETATSTGPQTNACHSPPGTPFKYWNSSTIAQSIACNAGTATIGANTAIAMLHGFRQSIEQSDTSQNDTKTTARWNGQ